MSSICLLRGRLRIRWDFFLLVLLVLLLCAEEIFFIMLPGILIHELGHILLLRLNGGSIGHVTLTFRGISIVPTGGGGGVFRCLGEILAGPLFSFVFAFLLAGISPVTAGFSLLFGLFNLLPCRCLDGGRAVETALGAFCDDAAGVSGIISAVVTAALIIAGAAAGNMILLAAGLWTMRPSGYIIGKKTIRR
mgnify:CR=1 FL=1